MEEEVKDDQQIDDEIAKLKDELSRLEQEREEVLKRES